MNSAEKLEQSLNARWDSMSLNHKALAMSLLFEEVDLIKCSQGEQDNYWKMKKAHLNTAISKVAH